MVSFLSAVLDPDLSARGLRFPGKNVTPFPPFFFFPPLNGRRAELAHNGKVALPLPPAKISYASLWIERSPPGWPSFFRNWVLGPLQYLALLAFRYPLSLFSPPLPS